MPFLNVLTPPPAPGAGVLKTWRSLVRELESAGATALVVDDAGHAETGQVAASSAVLVTSVGRATSSMGLVSSASAQYSQPYTLARELCAIDHLTHGRSGWYVQLHGSPALDALYGVAPQTSREDRLRRSREFIEVALGLWDGWEPGAQIPDRVTGNWVDETRIHPLNHHGEFYFVAGPLTTPRCPQDRPVVVMSTSGAADEVELAARLSDLAVPVAGDTAGTLAAVAELRERAVGLGRPATDPLLVAPAATLEPGESAGSVVERLGVLGEAVDGHTLVAPLSPELPALVAEVVAALGLTVPSGPTTLAASLGLPMPPRTAAPRPLEHV
jgi:alkanesulfonate monooxygenase SsuD/methylene tetrahydromethanopterin reductase-like flavin-dependent oxidoreductase (luciferase family)